MRILLAILLNALALAVAAFLVPGIRLEGWGDGLVEPLLAYLIVGAVFGVVNVVIKPIVSVLSLPITCLTLGLFAIVINGLMLMLTAWLTTFTPVEFVVESFFWDAVLGAIVVALVSALLNQFLVSPQRA
ncbi:phage holin family protein [Nesterenkonia natronophila]|uniref:Phage holin family protein n=1 Tax=Nesterenkonia natronophila TaxID=2174932 RepID=A0A3A4F4W9_9MICC|nr:phage holin family protein [Nesterenkonia natronophila]RJN32761.1 phage holin family protein [Nesterenkonia natronophila]